MKILTKEQRKFRRQVRSRARMHGTALRPRVSVSRSLTAMFAQLVDDDAGKTLSSVHSKKDAQGETGEYKGSVAVAYQLGLVLGKKAIEMNITDVVFDRSGYLYHGRVAALAHGLRDAGLKF